jgi:hypothetical protein
MVPLVVVAGDIGAYGTLTRAVLNGQPPLDGGWKPVLNIFGRYHSRLITTLTSIIHNHKGAVVSLPGDGFIAVFGLDEVIASSWRYKEWQAFGRLRRKLEGEPSGGRDDSARDAKGFPDLEDAGLDSLRVAPLRALLAAREIRKAYEAMAATCRKEMDAELPTVLHRPLEGIRIAATVGWCVLGRFDPGVPLDGVELPATGPPPVTGQLGVFGRPVNDVIRYLSLTEADKWHPPDQVASTSRVRLLRTDDLVIDHALYRRCKRLRGESCSERPFWLTRPYVLGKYEYIASVNLKHDEDAVAIYRVDPKSEVSPKSDAFGLSYGLWAAQAVELLNEILAALKDAELKEGDTARDSEGIANWWPPAGLNLRDEVWLLLRRLGLAGSLVESLSLSGDPAERVDLTLQYLTFLQQEMRDQSARALGAQIV